MTLTMIHTPVAHSNLVFLDEGVWKEEMCFDVFHVSSTADGLHRMNQKRSSYTSLTCAKAQIQCLCYLVFCKLIKMPTLYDCVYWHYTCSSICLKLLTADTPCDGCRGLTGWKSRPSCSTQAWQMVKFYFLISSLTALLAVHCNYIKVLFCVCWSKV